MQCKVIFKIVERREGDAPIANIILGWKTSSSEESIESLEMGTKAARLT
jgi:hypothetical protein